ncbi:hypothetical protein PoB_000894800 [Plakobranchus ocellatus]|uniref:F-box domain-containing protein n=1 Tax=Plakobranchus ocellatus TaxID=259542 RepID=A0AAV3YIV0_9GAST|nr:hypothetical protein PoB_000894800 [Plakobranchus ocellatus]
MGRRKPEARVKKKISREIRKRKNLSSWFKLPYPAIVKVMENLSDSERVNTAQVCKTWKDAFQNPGLWRTRHFELGGPKASSLGQNALAFVSSKGHFLERVSVTCRHITSNTCESITGTLEPFVACLGEADLKEFRIYGLELDRFWKYAHLRGKVADSLRNLLCGKRNLQVLEISLAQFGLLPGTEVLETVSQGCGSKLSRLLLEDFFHSRLAVFEFNRFRTVVQLLVDISIVGIGLSNSLVPILSPQIPLTSLYIWSGYDNDIPLQLSDTLNHIASSYATRLRSLHIDFDNYHDDIDEALIRVVAYCRNLRHLQIKANSSVMVANAVCQLVRERQTLLTSVDIMLCDMSDPDMEHLRDLREEMEPLAQEQGISLILHNDLF